MRCGRCLNRPLMLVPRLADLEQEFVERPRDEILAGLMNDLPPQPHRQPGHEVKDVYGHQQRAISRATLYREVAADLIDGYFMLPGSMGAIAATPLRVHREVR